jgi:cytidine deaminase
VLSAVLVPTTVVPSWTHNQTFVRTRDVAQPLAPCGICRQVIREFCALEMPILLVPAGHESDGTGAGLLETTVEELLPRSFGPEALELPRPG